MYRLDQVRVSIFAEEEALGRAVEKRLRRAGSFTWEILHRSLDMRNRKDPLWVYTIGVETEGKLDLPQAADRSYTLPVPGRLPEKPPVIVGFGPCGLFAGLILAEAGLAPIILERGAPMEERAKDVAAFWAGGPVDPESNVQYGEGGAGTFSDGKLTTGIKDRRVRKVLQTFVEAGADPSILFENRPHLGTDELRHIIPALRDRICALGGQVLFHAKMEGLDTQSGRVRGVALADGRRFETEQVVLAIGHSARDTFRVLNDLGLAMTPKPFSIGVRVEHLQSKIDRARYGDLAQEVRAVCGPADYRLSTHLSDGRGVYTFCMCPGGEVIMAATEPGAIVTNGMSDKARDGEYANSALLVDVQVEDYMDAFGKDGVLAGAGFQKHYEELAYLLGHGRAPTCRWESYEGSRVAASLPDFAAKDLALAMPILDRKLRGFADPDTRMIGVETRSSSPVRMVRDETFQSNIRGLYPAGEGAGYAGGITSAAVDGIRIAEAVIGSL